MKKTTLYAFHLRGSVPNPHCYVQEQRGSGAGVGWVWVSPAAWLMASLESSELLTVCCFTVASSCLPGLRKCDLGHLGVPTAEEYSQMYCDRMGVERPENWNFYMAFAFFRLAAMLQGLHRCSLAGEEPNHTSPARHRSPARAQTHEHRRGESSHSEPGEVGAAAHAAGFGRFWLCTLRPPKFQVAKQSVAFLAVLCFQHRVPVGNKGSKGLVLFHLWVWRRVTWE